MVEGSVDLVSVVIFWKGDNEESGEIKTHGLSDQGDSDDQQITVARIKAHFLVNVRMLCWSQASHQMTVISCRDGGGGHPEVVRNLGDGQTCSKY